MRERLRRMLIAGLSWPPLARLLRPVLDRRTLRLLRRGLSIGAHTYGYDADTFRLFMLGARIEVGAYCSFGPEVRVLAGSEHMLDRPSTFPFTAALFDPAQGNAGEAIDRGPTVIGNDVWIGLGAVVLSGVRVGDGAVIGAATVVTRDVPPYAVVVGNPARIVRYRFPPDLRERLLRVQWWRWSEEQIRQMRPYLEGDVEGFLDEAERRHGLAEQPPELARLIAAAAPHLVTPER